MYIFGVVLLVTIVAGIAMRRVNSSSGWHLAATLIGALSFVALVGLSISIPVVRADARDRLIRLEAFRTTIRTARTDKSLSEMERAAILKTIADWNCWLASENYWNHSQWAWWNLDVSGIEPLR